MINENLSQKTIIPGSCWGVPVGGHPRSWDEKNHTKPRASHSWGLNRTLVCTAEQVHVPERSSPKSLPMKTDLLQGPRAPDNPTAMRVTKAAEGFTCCSRAPAGFSG